MVLRNAGSSFVPGSYVFPGGRVDEADCHRDMEQFCEGSELVMAQRELDGTSAPEKALGIRIAAIRETFEEVGLLFARHQDGSLILLDGGDAGHRFRSYRRRVHGGELPFIEVLRRAKLVLALDRLHYFSHWITPELSPIRYDTRFFVAEVPSGQEALHDGKELTRHLWIKPEEALNRYHERRFHMVVPTIVTLEELAHFEAIDDVIDSTKGKGITGVMTRLVVEGDKIREHAPDGRIFRTLAPRR